MKLTLKIDGDTGEMSLHGPDGDEVKGVIAITQQTDPANQDRPAWVTVSIRGGKYDIEVT